ncbi:hypothetical protein ACHAPF_008301 [Botrytis cinerea]
MVKIPEIIQANASFGKNNDGPQGFICVFAGATSNIGASTLEALAKMLQSPTFYVLGRSATRFAAQRERLHSLNPQMKLEFLEVETSLILNIDAAWQELKMQDEDIGLLNPENFGPRVAINHTTTMTTLALEYLSQNDANMNITFIHSFPGLVASDNFSRLTAPDSFGLLGKILVPLIGTLFSVIQKIFGISTADCGARQAFLLTSDRFENGKTWRVDDKSEVITSSNDALEYYREKGWREKVFTHTLEVFEKATSTR